MVSPEDFEYLSRLLKERSGLALTPQKAYLITTRLKPLLESNNLRDVATMVRQLRSGQMEELKEEIVDAMTTNESLFFRDSKPFDALVETMLPELFAARGPRSAIKVWCAAASTGQEPYSIAMLLEEHRARFGQRDITILATDLSQAALRRAKAGEYTAFEVGRGMPPDILERYFRKTDRNHYVISPKIRSRVSFRHNNLLEPFNTLGQFDIVFCRNVLIYFDRPTKADVLSRISQIMSPDGYLVLGGPETTLGLSDEFERHQKWRNLYVRTRESRAATARNERLCA